MKVPEELPVEQAALLALRVLDRRGRRALGDPGARGLDRRRDRLRRRRPRGRAGRVARAARSGSSPSTSRPTSSSTRGRSARPTWSTPRAIRRGRARADRGRGVEYAFFAGVGAPALAQAIRMCAYAARRRSSACRRRARTRARPRHGRLRPAITLTVTHGGDTIPQEDFPFLARARSTAGSTSPASSRARSRSTRCRRALPAATARSGRWRRFEAVRVPNWR